MLLGTGGTDVTSLSGSSPPSSLSQSSGTSERLFGWTALEFSRGFPDLSYHLGEYMMPSPCIGARLLRAFFSSGQKVTSLMAGRMPRKPVPPAGMAVVYCKFSHRGPKYPTSSVPGMPGSFEYIGGSTASSPRGSAPMEVPHHHMFVEHHREVQAYLLHSTMDAEVGQD